MASAGETALSEIFRCQPRARAALRRRADIAPPIRNEGSVLAPALF